MTNKQQEANLPVNSDQPGKPEKPANLLAPKERRGLFRLANPGFKGQAVFVKGQVFGIYLQAIELFYTLYK